uniref:Uncharacterized protein n=1 Tax=Pipistrellus kuhlii TaxID=59472 RepID=A0A7J7UTY6_PIPKU|nr:hypothetical protein mPipKuh1_008739 [Pipistrellus kuhlii]
MCVRVLTPVLPESSHAPPHLPRRSWEERCRLAGSHGPSLTHTHTHTHTRPGFSLGTPGVKVVLLLLQKKTQLSPPEPLSLCLAGPEARGQAWQGQPRPVEAGGCHRHPGTGGGGDRCWRLQPATH